MDENLDFNRSSDSSRIAEVEEQLRELVKYIKSRPENKGPEFTEKEEELLEKSQYYDDIKTNIITKLKKQIEDLKSESSQYREQINKLKELIKKKDDAQGEFPKKIKERDDVIKQLNEQILILKEERRVLENTNSKLLSQIDFMQADIKKLDSQISVKDKQVEDVRELLQYEKDLSEQRLRKRLREFAEKETRKEVLLTVKIKELIDIVLKQREVIENINQADLILYDQFNTTIKQIHEKRSSINYDIVNEKIEDIKVDLISVSDLVNKQENEIVRAIEEKNNDEFEIEDSQKEEKYKKEVVESVRRSLENGDPPEIIKSTLLEKGEDATMVQSIIDMQMKELNIKL